MKKILLHGVFDERMGRDVCKELEDSMKTPETDVLIDINSPGGMILVLEDIVNMIDICRKRGIKVHTYNSGLAASCGASLLSYGDRRIVRPSSKTMIHEIGLSSIERPSVSDLEDIARELRQFNDKWFKWLAKNMRTSQRKLEKLVNRQEWWLSAQDALKYNVADEIGFEE